MVDVKNKIKIKKLCNKNQFLKTEQAVVVYF